MKKTSSRHPPKSKNRDKPGQPEDRKRDERLLKPEPAAAEDSDDDDPAPETKGSPSPGEATGTRRKPVTNHDEQEKITNAELGE